MKASLIFKYAMSHIDEMKDSTGTTTPEIDATSIKDYQARTPGILTAIQNDIAMYVGLEYLDEVKTMNGDVDLDDILCSTIVVYELCARLLVTDDAALSNYFSSLATEARNTTLAKYRSKATIEKITDLYGSSLRAGD